MLNVIKKIDYMINVSHIFWNWLKKNEKQYTI